MGNGQGTAHAPLASSLAFSPEKLAALQQAYLKEAAELWNHGLAGVAAGDKRFASEDWGANPVAAFSAATYLLNGRTLLGLVDPMHLAPEMVRRIQNIRAHGTLAKIDYLVSSFPRFPGIERLHGAERTAALSGRIRLARDVDSIERAFDAAKYGSFADAPWIELTIPSVSDPTVAGNGEHAVSAYVQYAPYHVRGTTWDAERDRLATAATRTIEQYAPGFESSIVSRTVVTPLDLERAYGTTGGHIFHGELSLDQWFVTRPLLGWARHRTPIEGLYLCGSGTHPGTGLDGRSGANAAREILKAMKR